MTKKQRCGTCIHLRIVPDSDGVRRVRKNQSYLCGAPAPDLSELDWADSYIQSVRSRFLQGILPARREGRQGTQCPKWELRK